MTHNASPIWKLPAELWTDHVIPYLYEERIRDEFELRPPKSVTSVGNLYSATGGTAWESTFVLIALQRTCKPLAVEIEKGTLVYEEISEKLTLQSDVYFEKKEGGWMDVLRRNNQSGKLSRWFDL